MNTVLQQINIKVHERPYQMEIIFITAISIYTHYVIITGLLDINSPKLLTT